MMTILSPSALRRVVFVGLLMACASLLQTAAARAQTFGYGGKNPAVATDGATLIHGNYCGAGNRPGKPPIDALDLACMNHDACSPTGGMPTCECNARLRDEAFAVSQDPRQTPELRSLASLTAAAASVMMCNPMNRDAVVVPSPPVQPAVAPVVQGPALPPVPPAAAAQAPAATVPAAPPPMTAAPLSIVPAGAAPAATEAAPTGAASTGAAPADDEPD